MSSPIAINQWEWVLVAENVTSVVLNEKAPGYVYYYTFRETGQTAPTAIAQKSVPLEAVRIFEYIPTEIIRSQYNIDVYILCFYPDDRFANPGAVRVDENLGATHGGWGKGYLDFNQDFELRVELGRIPNHSTVKKFGSNPLVTTATVPEDVWEYGGEYTYDADGTAPIVSLVSDDAADTMMIEVQGLDIDGEFVSQNITLNGTTRVALTTALWRVYRMFNTGTVDVAGTVYCYTSTGSVPAGADVRAIINGDNNQTLMALYTIPKGKVAFIHKGEAGLQFEASGPQAATDFAEIHYEIRLYQGVFAVKKQFTLLSSASSIHQDRRVFPDTVPALSDIRVRVKAVSDDMGVWATFDILLIDETEFPEDYLISIGQPGY